MNTNQIAHIAALIGEAARTGMLIALGDGRALTAHELAQAGRVSPATASRHLALMVEAGLLVVESQGRHRYHRIASVEVARLLEGLMQLAARQVPAPRPVVVGPRDAALRRARTCYDHIAGRLGVAIAAHLLEQRAIAFDDEAGGRVTERAATVLEPLGLAAQAGLTQGPARRPLCRPCLDWSERRAHVAGRLGTLLCTHCLERGWLRRARESRALEITPRGTVALSGWLGPARWREIVEG
ncbi:MAG: Transcriptional regulator, ArsR family [Burkholderiaceae bacterium]|jgi:DNA-binding transcriptional ArsR family regulator|nr:MAG: Transcriptional regulator, ArsR family [Burkholderiaceae bacterium]